MAKVFIIVEGALFDAVFIRKDAFIDTLGMGALDQGGESPGGEKESINILDHDHLLEKVWIALFYKGYLNKKFVKDAFLSK